jgi:hypothetical protein
VQRCNQDETTRYRISGEHVTDAGVLEVARAVAEAQLQLHRVKAFKSVLLGNRVLLQSSGVGPVHLPTVEIPADLFLQYEGVKRYERLALSRRKFAARQFNKLVRRSPRILSEPIAGRADQYPNNWPRRCSRHTSHNELEARRNLAASKKLSSCVLAQQRGSDSGDSELDLDVNSR